MNYSIQLTLIFLMITKNTRLNNLAKPKGSEKPVPSPDYYLIHYCCYLSKVLVKNFKLFCRKVLSE